MWFAEKQTQFCFVDGERIPKPPHYDPTRDSFVCDWCHFSQPKYTRHFTIGKHYPVQVRDRPHNLGDDADTRRHHGQLDISWRDVCETRTCEVQLQMPEAYRLLGRSSGYGSFVNFFVCGLAIRYPTLDGGHADTPMVQVPARRCK